MNRPQYAIAAVFGALLAAQPVLAETAAITFDDLDLKTAEGKAELDRRVEKAAKEICGYNEAAIGSRMASREAQMCMKDTQKQIKKSVAAIVNNKAAGG